MHVRRVLVPALVALVVVAGCGSASTPAPTSGSASVVIQNYQYTPQVLNVTVGTTVTWTNRDPVPHTVTADNGAFSSGNLSQGATFSFTFTKPGTYEYYCEIHTFMHGTIVVH